MSSIKFNDNSKEVLNAMANSMDRALYAIGTEAVGDVVKYMSKIDFTGKDIVDNGRLRGSISFLTPEKASGANDSNAKSGDALSGRGDKNSVLVGTNVEYAGYVNNGTSTRKARKFLQNGINPNKSKYMKTAESIFKGEL